MGVPYKLEMSTPANVKKGARVWTFDAGTNNLASVDVELKKDGERISFLTAVIEDPRQEIFNALPDPAFSVVPVRFSMGVVAGSERPQVVFDGVQTSLLLSYPGVEHITIVAHDKSIQARRQKKYRSYANKTSTQLIELIGREHGLEVVIEVDDLGSIKPREFCFGAELTDWEFATRALSFDGLETYADGRQLRVRRAAKQLYRTIFKRGQHPVMGLEVGIHHIASGADKSGSPALENGDTAKALTGAAAEEAAKVKADERTHRRPVGAAEKSNVSHGEAPGNAGWTNEANLKRRRKDDATLTLAASPDIRLHHYVRLEGWGGKVDGDWILPTIKHGLIKGEFPTTQLTLARAVSSSASSAAGIPFAQ